MELRTSSTSSRKSTLGSGQSNDVTRILPPTSLLSANVVLSVVPRRSRTLSTVLTSKTPNVHYTKSQRKWRCAATATERRVRLMARPEFAFEAIWSARWSRSWQIQAFSIWKRSDRDGGGRRGPCARTAPAAWRRRAQAPPNPSPADDPGHRRKDQAAS